MSLLSIIQNATDLLAVPRPTVVVSSTDPQIRQLYALAHEEGDELSGRGDWQVLTREQTFVTTATEIQASAIPTDFDHFIADTVFDRTAVRKMHGPMLPQQWQQIKANGAYALADLLFRQRGNDFLIAPVPPAGHTVAFEYVSSYWAASDASVPKAGFTSDQDTCRLDETLVKLGVIWRFKQAKGLDYSEDMATYERDLAIALARDGGMRSISVGSPQYSDRYGANVPEVGFGV